MMKRTFANEFLVGLLLLLLVTLLRLPSLHQPFENDSGAIAYHARLIIQGEPLYSTHHPAHHMPGAYYVYALAFSLFGDSVSAVKLVLIVWVAATTYLIYRLGVLVGNRIIGLMAAVLAAALFSHLWLAGSNARIESFVGLPQVAAVLTLLTLKPGQSRPWLWLFAGLFSAIAFLFKANYLSPLVLVGVVLLAHLRQQREQRRAWPTIAACGLWTGAGFTLGVLSVAAYFSYAGALSRLLQLFSMGLAYGHIQHPTLNHPAYLLLYPILILGNASAPILISGISGLVFVLLEQAKGNNRLFSRQQNRGMVVIALWFLLCFLETSFSRVFLLNYYLVYVPPLSLLAAWFFYSLYLAANSHMAAAYPLMAPALLAAMLSISLVVTFRQHRSYYEHYYFHFASGRESYSDFLTATLPNNAGETMLALQEVADYVHRHTAPGDTIYYWSNLMELYYMADRRAATDVIWPVYVEATGPRERIFSARYIILGETPLGYDGTPAWLKEGLARAYELEVEMHGQQIYRRH